MSASKPSKPPRLHGRSVSLVEKVRLRNYNVHTKSIPLKCSKICEKVAIYLTAMYQLLVV